MRKRWLGLGVGIAMILLLVLLWPRAEDVEPQPLATPDLEAAESGGLRYDVANVTTSESRPPDNAAIVPASEYHLHVRVFTREGNAAAGASVEVYRFTGGGEGDPEAEPIPLVTDENGETSHIFQEPGRFVALCRWEDQAAEARFSFTRDSVVQLDLVLERAARIAGRTVDSLGRALPGASVACLLEGEIVETVASDDSGRFQLAGAAPLPVLLRGTLERYPAVVVEHAEAGREATLVFSRGAQVISTILDRDSRSPVRGFPLVLRPGRLSGLREYSGTSDGQGIANIQGVTPGAYQLLSDDPSFALARPGEKVTVVAEESYRVDVLVASGGSIAGRVFDADTGKGIPGVYVQFKLVHETNWLGDETVTKADGAFEMASLSAGQYRVGLRGVPRAYGGRYSEYAVVESRQIMLAPGEALDDVEFALTSGEAFGGRVVFADGSPAPGASVSAAALAAGAGPANLATWAADTVADADGRFLIYDLPDEPISLHARWRDYESDTLGPIAKTSAPADGVVLTLKSRPVGSLAGQVVDANGEPVQAHVKAVALKEASAFDQRLSSTTDREGYFLFTEVPPGDYEFSYGARRGGLVDFSHSDGPYTLSPGQSMTGIRLELTGGGLALSGMVLNAAGEPVPNFMLEVESRNADGVFEPTATTMTDENGNFRLENVAEGDYRLYPTHRDQAGTWTHTMEAGEEVEIVLPEPGSEAIEANPTEATPVAP